MGKWTIDQEKAITQTGTNIIVSAGAGSGKTAVLTERTIRKLLNGTCPCDVIDMRDYGTMNGAKVLDTALKMYEEFNK
mgnify:CR=1 FL=1